MLLLGFLVQNWLKNLVNSTIKLFGLLNQLFQREPHILPAKLPTQMEIQTFGLEYLRNN